MNISLIVLSIAVPMMVVERLYPGTARVSRKLWLPRALTSIAAQAGIVFVAASTWDQWLSHYSILPGHNLGPALGAAIGYLTITFIFYWWHRARHEVSFLWRTLHQIHHSRPGSSY